jgi:RimJ/RimL family protein N-acetyltransferase
LIRATLDVVTELRTERLLLRHWRDADLVPFAALNEDPEGMRYFPAPLSRGESDALAERARHELAQRGWGLWAVGVRGGEPFIGFVGLAEARFEAPFTPAIEVGWRLAQKHWGHGYATEGARAAVAFGFRELGLLEIVSFTSAMDHRSRKVMERLGMRRESTDDFLHPLVPPGPLRAHVLYRLRAPPSPG